MPTEKELTNLVINKIENLEVFKYMQNNSLINADELYLVGGDDDVATQTENGLMSAEDKTKLDGIEKGAEVNVQTDWNEKDSTSDAFLKNKPTSLPANGGNADTVNGHTVKSNVPENAVFTDTTYDAAGENLGLVKSGGDVTIQDGTITIPSLGDKANKSTTLVGYGIEDAKISDGVITLGSNTIIPVTSVNGKSGASVTLDKTNIGLGNVDNVKQYSASNPPPYPVTSVNGQIGDVTISAELPENLVQYDVLGEVEPTQTINADTLQGHAASYFATGAEVSALSTVVDSNTDNITANAQNISTNTQNISTLQSDITALQSSVKNKLSKSGGTMKGALVAQNNTNYTTKQVRNIFISTADPSGGDSGDIWIKYTE